MKRDNKKLLSEELQRFKQINEYDFYVGEDDEYDETDNLILGEEGDEEEDLGIDDLPADDSNTADAGEEVEPADDLEADIEPEGGEEGMDDLEAGDEELDADVDVDVDAGAEDFADEAPAEDEVELDVTDLVQGTEEAKQVANDTSQKVDQLMGMLDNLEGKLDSMDGITNKIDNLENELEKRAPTPEEKIEMRSLDSFPYNLKLTDFWAEKDGQYDVMGVNDKEEEPEEYTLTSKDVDDEYNEAMVRSSFSDDNPYEEEEI